MGNVENYESLDVYQHAFRAALDIHLLSLTFPKIEQYAGIADQIRRCSKGICANIAEGLSKQMSLADKKRFLQMAMGSTEETRVWVSFAMELEYVEADRGKKVREEYQYIMKMLVQLQKSLKY